jgi:hypothetical protein
MNDINTDKITINSLYEYIKNNHEFVFEKKFLEMYKNLSKIFFRNNQKFIPGITSLLRTQSFINKYFNKDMTIMIITETFTHLLPIIHMKKIKNLHISLVLFDNNGKSKDMNAYFNFVQKLNNSNNVSSIYGSYDTNIKQLLYQKYEEQYDLVNITYSEYNYEQFVSSILIALENIKNHGSIIIDGFYKNIPNDNNINTLSFILSLLISKFKNYQIITHENSTYLKTRIYIKFDNYKNNDDDKELITQLKKQFVSNFTQIKITNNGTKKGLLLINKINQEINIFNQDLKAKLEVFNYNQESYIRITVNQLFTEFKNVINYCDENKIPYNKYYLHEIDNYYQHIINNLFSLSNPIKNTIITYNQKSYQQKKTQKIKKNVSKKLGKYSSQKAKSNKVSKQNIYKIDNSYYKNSKPYTYDFFNHITDKLSFIKTLRKNIITLHGYEYLAKVSKITEDFTRGLSSYLDDKFKLPHKPSNAFVKIWEIYTTFNLFDHRKKKFNTFHFCEAPGQFIWSTEYFIKKKLGYDYSFNWHANSLNHKHPKNIELYGKVFGDDYGFIKKYPERWLYGKDDTGDITKSENIRHFREQIKEIGPQDIVTGDAGLLSSEIPLIKLQLLEFAQICMVAATSSLGGHCVVKHFTPFLNSQEDSVMAGGLFVNMIYLYSLMFDQIYLFKPYTSKPSSGEFYIIGKKFLGVSDSDLDTLLSVLDNFHLNQTFFNKNKLNDSFVRQVFDFVDKMSNYNIQTIEKENFFMTCLADKDDKLRKTTNCMDYMNPDKLGEIQKKRFKEWVRMYDFV